jgi:hypothetical protein
MGGRKHMRCDVRRKERAVMFWVGWGGRGVVRIRVRVRVRVRVGVGVRVRVRVRVRPRLQKKPPNP